MQQIKFFLILLAGVFYFKSYSQKISGTVYDIKNQPISSAIIKFYDSQDIMVEFTNTNQDGYFASKLSATEMAYLIVTKFGYEDFRIDLSTQNNFKFEIQLNTLENPITYLDEVEVKAPTRLYNSLDTLTYQADSLRNQNVRTVEDLISNIPGVSIDINTGRISYQNKPISTILIDGDNLTGINYQTFSKNISDKIASSVQVIEGFEENPFLKQFKRSSSVALNIKTDSKEKTIYSGSVSIGGGYQDRYLGGGNFLTINQKVKNLITASTNDIGNFSFGQNFELEKKSVNDQLLRSVFYNFSHDFLSKINPVLSMSYNQNLSENEEFFINDNLQLKSSKSELLIKSYLYKDVLSQKKSDIFLIKSGSDQSIFSNIKEDQSTPSNWGVSLNHNFNFSNKTRWESQILFNRKSFDETSRLNNNQTFFQNELGKNVFYLKSDIFIKPSSKLLFYSYNHFKLDEITDAFILSGDSIFSPNSAESLNILEQDYFSRNLHFNNTSGLITRKGTHHIFELATQFDYHKTDIKENQSDNTFFENEFYNFSGMAKWTKAIRTTIFEAGVKSSVLTGNNMPDKFLVFPNLHYKWKNIYTNIDINVLREIAFLDNKFWINNFLSSGFQSFISSTVDSSNELFSVSNIFNSSIYHNLRNGLFDVGLNIQASHTALNFIPDFSANDNFFISGILPFDADEYVTNTSFEISKFISKLSQNFRIVPSHSYTKTVYASNNDIFRNESNVYSIRFESKSAYDGWLNFHTGFTFRNQVFSDKNLTDKTLNNSSNHFFSGFFNLNLNYLDDKLSVKINNNLYDFNTGGTYFYVGDILVIYKAKKNPLELSLIIKNFTDQRKFSLFRETPSTISSNNTFLRPLSAVLNFKYVF